MLQQPSEFVMYQALPLDLTVHTPGPEVSPLPPDFHELGLHLQAQTAAATQAFFFDTSYAVKTVVRSATTVPAGPAVQAFYDLPLQPVYSHPAQYAMYSPAPYHHLQQQQPQDPQYHSFRHPQQLPQQLLHHHLAQHASSAASSGPLSVGSWRQLHQLESRGSWFPNWQEFFHGLSHGKDGPQQKQSAAPYFQPKPPIAHQGGIEASSDATAVGAKEPLFATAPVRETQRLSPHCDGVQTLDPCLLAPTGSGHGVSHLPYPAAEVNKQRIENQSTPPQPASATKVPMVSDAQTSIRPVDSGRAQLDEASPSCSYASTALLPYITPEPGKGREFNLVSSTDLKDPRSPAPIEAIACRYITQSPAWLPPGWITEVQTRRRGATAGTRDKYYREPGSGRRFRSRNEVIRFLQTGRGRLRRKKRRKALLYSGFGGPQNLLSHQPHSLAQDATVSPCLFLAPQPIGFVLGPSVRSRHGDATVNVPLAPCSGAEEAETSCRTPVAPSTTSCAPVVMLGHKQTGEGRPQKLPTHRKEKTLAPKKCEDKQASRLWQWLQKPARTIEQPQNQDADRQSNKNGKNAEDAVRETGIAQRSSQLGKEIELAQKTVMRLDREMQATFEKLTWKIQAAERETNGGSDDAISIAIQAAKRLDIAMGTVTQSTQNLISAMGVAVQAVQSSAQQCQGAVHGEEEEAQRQDVAMMQSVSTGRGAQAVEWPGVPTGNSARAAEQPEVAASGVQEASSSDAAMVHLASGRGCASQEPDLAMGYLIQGQQMPNGVMVYATNAANRADLGRGYMAQALQSPDIMLLGTQTSTAPTCTVAEAPQNPLVMMNSAWTHATMPRIDVATGTFDASYAHVPRVGEPSTDMHPYWKAVEMSRNIVEARLSRHIMDLKRDLKLGCLNRGVDVRMLDPNLDSRKRAKAIQKMKAKRARALLVLLGRKVCLKALGKTAVRML